MASALVVRASAGTTTNPDRRQRLIEHQAASKPALALPNSDSGRLPPTHQQPLPSATHSSLPAFDGEVGFTASLIAQALAGERRKYAHASRPTLAKAPQTRLRDFLV